MEKKPVITAGLLNNIFDTYATDDKVRACNESNLCKRYVDELEKLLFKLLPVIEEKLVAFNPKEWVELGYENTDEDGVGFIYAGRGLYIENGVYAQLLLTKSGVRIWIQDGAKWVNESIERLKLSIAGWVSLDELESLLEPMFNEFKQYGISGICVEIGEFKYTNC